HPACPFDRFNQVFHLGLCRVVLHNRFLRFQRHLCFFHAFDLSQCRPHGGCTATSGHPTDLQCHGLLFRWRRWSHSPAGNQQCKHQPGKEADLPPHKNHLLWICHEIILVILTPGPGLAWNKKWAERRAPTLSNTTDEKVGTPTKPECPCGSFHHIRSRAGARLSGRPSRAVRARAGRVCFASVFRYNQLPWKIQSSPVEGTLGVTVMPQNSCSPFSG